MVAATPTTKLTTKKKLATVETNSAVSYDIQENSENHMPLPLWFWGVAIVIVIVEGCLGFLFLLWVSFSKKREDS
jgi:hypothetical protein